ncbi:MAG TPA: bacteriohopanetetrol glucosamine biosynthesis glycosyltransferase HpnI [Terriglobales bacterium]|jgi:ceramide glucosyltransferase|nr:MAG: glycosyl transferase [Acidobacteriota bacterium]HLB88218.1 bacteriohopanetetrol glucosamine biosynthesis glycosyltransferase HpnI [Terriglobales bacterium]
MTIHPGAWRDAVLLLAAAPLVYYMLATVAALRFFRRERARKLPNYTPPVSLLKPVRGLDFGTYENFASFCRLDYPEYEILFAVNDECDPAMPVIEQVMAEFPGRRIRLLVGAEDLGANRKVNKLARLAKEAQNDVLVLTDGDVRVGSNFLREVVAPLADEKTGAVTSFYRGIAERNLWAELEAVGASGDFFAGVLVADWTEGIHFGLGASIATTKKWISKMGGFEAIAGTLADDYELGNRIAKAGGVVMLSREAVWTMYPAQTPTSFWSHQMRWARTIRLLRPWSYAGLLLTHGLPWTLLAALVAPARWMAASYLVAYAVLRLTMAWTVGVWGVRDDVLRKKIWLVPLRDAFYFVIWLAGFGSNRITWGNDEYLVRDGQMVPVLADKPSEGNPAAPTPR